MSRYSDYDDFEGEPEQILAMGRWQRNARAVLCSKRGRKALATIRDALNALPEKRLIEGALCTVGGPARVAEVTDAEIDAYIGRLRSGGTWRERAGSRDRVAGWLREERTEEREAIARSAERQGCGVCLNGALLWYLNVQAGMTADQAFAAIPSVTAAHRGYDTLVETARIAEQDAGVAYTLAWELAYRNDETFSQMTPEERHAEDRDEADYAFAALNTAGLPDAKQLDGFADLAAQADITFVVGDE